MIGVPWVWAVGLGPALSIGLLGTSVVFLWALDAVWTPLTALGTVAVTVAAIVVAWRLLTTRFPVLGATTRGSMPARAEVVAAGLAVVVCAARFIWLVPTADAISQGIDAPFHVNLITQMIHDQVASPVEAARLTDAAGIYPPLWHAFGTLVEQICGTDAMVAQNAVNLIVCVLVWPLSVMTAVRAISGGQLGSLMPAAIATGGLAIFPWVPLEAVQPSIGALFPFVLSTAMLPLALPLLATIFGQHGSFPFGRIRAYLILGFLIAGMGMSQPAGVVAVLALSLPFGVVLGLRRLRYQILNRAPFICHLRLATAGTVLMGLFIILWVYARPAVSAWTSFTDPWTAVGGALLGAPLNGAVSWLLALLILSGVLVAWRRRIWWLLGTFTVMCLLYVAGASGPPGLRALAIGAWWGDNVRTAGMLAMFYVVFIGLAGSAVVQCGRAVKIAKRLRRLRVAVRPAALSGVMLLVIAGSILVPWRFSPPYEPDFFGSFRVAPDSPILSSDELTLARRISGEVPQGAVIANNPFDGSTMIYAISGRRVLFPHALRGGQADRIAIAESLATASPGSPVCSALQRQHVAYAVEFGGPILDPTRDDAADFSGIRNLGSASTFQLIDHEGEAKLYRIVGCG